MRTQGGFENQGEVEFENGQGGLLVSGMRAFGFDFSVRWMSRPVEPKMGGEVKHKT